MADGTGGAPGGHASPTPSKRPAWVQVLQGVQCGGLVAAALTIRPALHAADAIVLLWLGPFIIGRMVLSLRASAGNRSALFATDVSVPSRAAVMALGLGDLTVVGYLLLRWHKDVVETSFANSSLLALAALVAALGLALTSRLLEHRADPLRLHALSLSGGPGRFLRRLRAWAAHATLLAATALTAVALMLAPVTVRALASPVTAHLADDVPAPAAQELPQSVAGELVWMRDLDVNGDSDVDVLPGAGGPILIQGSVVTCLSAQDGATRWSVERQGSTIARALVSPDGKSLVVVYRGLKPLGSVTASLVVIVLDAITGRQIAQHDVSASDADSGTGIQVTDHVVLVGGQAISLEDGSTPWSIPRPQARSWRTAGSSTLVTQVQCESAQVVEQADAGPPRVLCDLTLVDDQDPTRVRTLTNVVAAADEKVVIVRGWTVRVADGAADGELATADLEVVNIDDGATWPIGDSLGPIDDRAGGAGLRGRASMILLRPPVGEPQGSNRFVTAVDRVLDPATGALTRTTGEVEEGRQRDLGYPTADLTTAALSPQTPTITVARNGDGPATVVDLPMVGPAGGTTLLQAVPGGVLLIADLTPDRTVIYFLR